MNEKCFFVYRYTRKIFQENRKEKKMFDKEKNTKLNIKKKF